MWCVAELDEQYIARMEDVLAVYEKPLSAREPVVCIDEKPVVLHQDVRPPVAMQPGRVARRDSEYRRCGTANVFCGVQPKAGRHFTKATDNRSSPEFADYLLDIAAAYPEADTIHLVMDNLSSHKVAGVREWIESAGAELLYLPPYSPDLNPIEKAWAKLKQLLRSAKARTKEALEQAIADALKRISPENAKAWFRLAIEGLR